MIDINKIKYDNFVKDHEQIKLELTNYFNDSQKYQIKNYLGKSQYYDIFNYIKSFHGFTQLLLNKIQDYFEVLGYEKVPKKEIELNNLISTGLYLIQDAINLIDNNSTFGLGVITRAIIENLVVTLVIEECDENTLSKYIEWRILYEHRIVKAKEKILVKSVNNIQINDVNDRFKDFKKKYKNNYCSNYGWAADYLNIEKPKINDLIVKISMTSLELSYTILNSFVHLNQLVIKNEFIDGLLVGKENINRLYIDMIPTIAVAQNLLCSIIVDLCDKYKLDNHEDIHKIFEHYQYEMPKIVNKYSNIVNR